jgi:hypothetical protein
MGVLRGSAALLATLFALVSCTATSGTGSGALAASQTTGPAHDSVRFAWAADQPGLSDGVIAAQLGGVTFRGRYQQEMLMSSEAVAQSQVFGRVHDPGWWKRIADEPWWEPGYYAKSGSRASDRVTCLLRAPDRTRMTCDLTLVDPTQGLGGGAQGQCRLSSGETIRDVVLAER